ncbi:MAG TPA: FKBP-type peptidyl-prolyl cis-trans isomerase, partial [Chthoniobacterales bacterium]|nr:FKBP-type peptidyl-prolyl cis-trans isomerase [Chthoniobacterales bacterium]
ACRSFAIFLKIMKKILLLVAFAGMLGTSVRVSAQTSSNAVEFERVTVTDATNMRSKPKVTAESSLPAAKIKFKDLVMGKGDAATPASSVTVQYVGVRYADGKQFDSSWEKGGPISFRLNKVVKGFTQGIGGNDSIPPMKVGGRRLMILPSELAYGERGTLDGSIQPNDTIVFVVDLIAVK